MITYHYSYCHFQRTSVAQTISQATAAFSAMAQEMATEWQRAQRAASHSAGVEAAAQWHIAFGGDGASCEGGVNRSEKMFFQ